MRRLLLLFMAACAPKDFASSSRVDSLRVLAVRADLPFAEPGESVKLSALVADPLGQGRAVTLAWATCENPGSGEIAACAARLGSFRYAPVADGIASFDVAVPKDALDAGPIGTIGVVFAACAGTFVFDRREDAAPIGCVLGDRLAGRDAFMWGMKRITVLASGRNQNPGIARVYANGRRWDEGFDLTITPCPGADVPSCADESKLELVVELEKGAAEAYLGRTEDIVTFFFASQGSISDEVVRGDAIATSAFAATAIDPSRPVDLWFVVRDDRGGVSFTKRTARAR